MSDQEREAAEVVVSAKDVQHGDERAWEVLSDVVNGSLKEQRKARRWGIFFKLLTFAYLAAFFVFLWMSSSGLSGAAAVTEQHVGLVKVNGVIAPEEEASANAIVGALRDAFENDNCAAIILAINSPGGSPVQSGQVYDEINRLKAEYPEKTVYAAISDLGASGAYYIAAAADMIYADKASLVGSIGVVGSSFGFVDTMEKLGVERRLFTAGEHKGFLDPFSPVNQVEKEFWEGVLKTTHDQFVSVVREGRGDKLQDRPELFSGLIWSGEQALQLGLIDALGSAGYVAREIVGEEKIIDYSRPVHPLDRVLKQLGVGAGQALWSALSSSRYPSLN